MNLIFHFCKHHIRDTQIFIQQMIQKKIEESFFISFLKRIGNNHLDLYTGNLRTKEIILQIQKKDYHIVKIHWNYHLIQLTDNSLWVIKFIKKYDRHILHLHPAKKNLSNSKSIRLHANTYKTLLMAYWFFQINKDLSISQVLTKSRETLSFSVLNFSKSKTPELFYSYFIHPS